MNKIKLTCEIEYTIHMIGGKYKPIILETLLYDGTQRFGELLKLMPSISKKTLTNQLRELEEDNLIIRTTYPEVPPRVEYSISERGKTLEPVLAAMCDWGNDYLDDRYELTTPQCSAQ